MQTDQRRPARKAKLTEKLIAELRPDKDEHRTVLWDSEVGGFGVVAGRHRRSFVVKSRVDRRQVMATIGVHGQLRDDGLTWTVTLARKKAREVLGQMAGGVDVAAGERPGGPTLRAGLKLHLENMRKKHRSERSFHTLETEVERLFSAWMDRPIADLTGAELARLHGEIQAAVAARAEAERLGADGPRKRPTNPDGAGLANRAVQHISGIWNSLDRVHELPGRNPARAVTKNQLKPRQGRIGRDGFAEWHSRVLGLSEVARDFHLFALFTGVRVDGIRHVRHDDLNEEFETCHISHAKGGKPYTIPLGTTALEILKQRKADNAALMKLFGGDDGWIFPTVTRAKPFRVIPCAEPKRWGLPALHDLRRTFNSVALEIGVPDPFRNMLMNHDNAGVNLKHYSVPQEWGPAKEWQVRIDAAIWERIRSPQD